MCSPKNTANIVGALPHKTLSKNLNFSSIVGDYQSQVKNESFQNKRQRYSRSFRLQDHIKSNSKKRKKGGIQKSDRNVKPGFRISSNTTKHNNNEDFINDATHEKKNKKQNSRNFSLTIKCRKKKPQQINFVKKQSKRMQVKKFVSVADILNQEENNLNNEEFNKRKNVMKYLSVKDNYN